MRIVVIDEVLSYQQRESESVSLVTVTSDFAGSFNEQ